MGFTDYKLKYLIEGDNANLKKAVQDSERTLGALTRSVQSGAKSAASEVSNVVSSLTGNRLSGAASQVTSLANAFGAIPGPAGLAIGSIAAVGTVAVGVGGALLELTKKAADYGSIIHDASDKTGLHAETLSAMDLAAKQSGTTLDTVTAALAKFAKNVSTGKDELKAFGITPKQAINDLDGSLAKVFKRIIDAKPGYEQIVLAQKAFGKSGADLLPFIKQFDGNLPALIAHAKQLGVTLSDEDAKAADEFGDQMTELDVQLASIGRTIGRELMPVFLDMSKHFSSWLASNKDEWRSWGEYVADIIRGTAKSMSEFNESSAASVFMGYIKAVVQGTGLGQLASGLAYEGQQERIAHAPPAWTGRGFQLNPNTFTLEAQPEQPQKPTGVPDFSEKTKGAGKFPLSATAQAIVDAARKIGISPLDLATIIGYESAGTFSTSIDNGKGHFGLIQFGKDEAAQYGARKGQSFSGQLEAVDKYLIDRFAKAGVGLEGANLLQLYKAVLAGSPAASGSFTDANHTSPNSAYHQMLFGGGKAFTQADALKKFFGGKESNIPSDKNGRSYSETLKKEYDEDEKNFKEYLKQKLDIQKAGDEQLLTRQELELRTYDEAGASYEVATEKSAAVARLKKQINQDEIDSLEDLYDGYIRAATGAEDQTRKTELLAKAQQVRNEIDLKTIEVQTKALQIEADRSASVKKLTDRFYDLDSALTAVEKANEEYQRDNPYPESTHGTGSTRQIDRSFNATDALRQHFESLNSVGGDFGVAAVDAATTAFQQLGQAVGDAVSAFVLYGNAGTSVRKVTAQILAAIAQQAAVQAIYELAQGLAVLALAFFGVPNAGPSATMHFAAAATYGLVAGVTAVAGRAVAGNSFNKSKGGSSGVGGSSAANQINQNPSPYTRASADAYLSGNRSDRQTAAAIREHTELLRQFYHKIDSMPAGEILTTGMRQKRGIIGQQVVQDLKSNGGLATQIRRVSGGR